MGERIKIPRDSFDWPPGGGHGVGTAGLELGVGLGARRAPLSIVDDYGLQ